MAPRGGLAEYNRKRNFARTGGAQRASAANRAKRLSYLIQKHAARRLHYDFRLEWNGTLMSWAVPKGPSENPQDKRLAVHVEDHPVEYGKFEGTIPEGEYGGGTVMLWDRGTWEPHGDVDEALKKGKLAFDLHGERLHGQWALVRLRARDRNDKDNWLLIKERDELARKSRRRGGEGRDQHRQRPQHGRDRRRQEGLAQQPGERENRAPLRRPRRPGPEPRAQKKTLAQKAHAQSSRRS